MGKGSSPRPFSVDQKTYEGRYMDTFAPPPKVTFYTARPTLAEKVEKFVVGTGLVFIAACFGLALGWALGTLTGIIVDLFKYGVL